VAGGLSGRAAARLAALIPAATLAIGSACATASPPAAPPPLSPARSPAALIDSIIDSHPLDRTSWGILVRDAATGGDLFARNADRLFIPASNTKLVVTLVAMGLLGPDWRYRTVVEAAPADAAARSSVPAPAARVNASAAAGATHVLIVRGAGDPTLSARYHDSDTAPLDTLAARIAGSGISHVGDVYVDATRFTGPPVHSAWEIGDLPFGYAAPTAAFAIGEGTFRLERSSGRRAGDPVSLRLIDGDTLQPIRADVTTDSAGARPTWRIDFMQRIDTVHITGTILPGVTDTVRLAVTDPERHAGLALVQALQRRSVRVDGTVRVLRDSAALRMHTGNATWRAVAMIESPPMREIIAGILKPSQNWMAEQVLRTLGAERGEEGSWAGGLDVERAYLTDIVGLDSLQFSLRDASGLSAQNLLTPAAILRVLEYAAASPWANDYRNALPTAGEEDGTLRFRLAGTEDRLRAKTGTIANVNSLSGYIRREDGSDLVFAILSNGSGLPSRPVRDAIDAVVRVIERLGGSDR
jgi:serine-type D-Ala-D-Ala carboxypeptidase/endopeptidase (penicillin-binding protein 4)